ncbi:MAG: ComEA family DNA-binding protein [Acidimicrobiia bacterium]|nr:ComEA family DNA-binding protein [Acidimicrobiia bacterium]
MRLAVGVIGVALVVASTWFFTQPAAPVAPDASPVAVVAASTITVHISGAVQRPGLVEVPFSARVADVVAAAGGSTPDAMLAAINLAATVRDGEQIVIPDASEPVAAAGDGKVRLNTATQAELESIPGIGPVLASRIVAARDEQGGFSSIEDLLDVSGIGEAKLASFRDVVTVP